MNAKKQAIDKKSIKLKRRDASDEKKLSTLTEVPSSINMLNLSHLPSSQECFTVGWDWSGQCKKNNKPSIHVIERPVKRINDDSKLLKCHRPRRLVRECDPAMFDASVFADELKSLASDFKPVPESNSPVTSPPHSSFKRRREVLSTPTSTKISSSAPKSPSIVENAGNAVAHGKIIEKIEVGKECLDDLLDDSLGADLLKLTQDVENNLDQKESKTPNLQDIPRGSSSKRRNRLSLSSKKEDSTLQKNVCRRINDLYDQNHTSSKNHNDKPQSAASKGNGQKQDQQNNNTVALKIDFDDIDEATLQTIDELEEKEMVKSKELIPNNIPPVSTASFTNKVSQSALTFQEDDEAFNSPELLEMIDEWERKATQKIDEGSSTKESSSKTLPVQQKHEKVLDILDFCDLQHEAVYGKKVMKQEVSLKIQPPSRKKALSVPGGSIKCTAEEIEKKRLEAKKRLQLKRKQ